MVRVSPQSKALYISQLLYISLSRPLWCLCTERLTWVLDGVGGRERIEYVERIFDVAESFHEQYGVNSNSKKSLHDEREPFDKSVNESRGEKRIKLYVDHNVASLQPLTKVRDFIGSATAIEDKLCIHHLFEDRRFLFSI